MFPIFKTLLFCKKELSLSGQFQPQKEVRQM